MKFKVHYDLKNFPKALKKLSRSTEDSHFEEAIQIIKKQRLYKVALEFYSDQPDRIKAIRVCFGDYLEQRGFHDEAGAMFLSGGALEKSQNAYLRSFNVDMCLAVLA